MVIAVVENIEMVPTSRPAATALMAPILVRKRTARRMSARHSRVLNGVITTAPRRPTVTVEIAATRATALVLPLLRKEIARATNLPVKAAIWTA